MSRTDKDRPYWLQDAESGLIDHDHRTGKCVISDDRRDRWTSWRNHWRKCKKREVVDFTCTKQDPYIERYRSQRNCWRYDYVRTPGVDFGYGHYEWTRCVGHSRVEYHNEIPCACDNMPEPATCVPAWNSHRQFYSSVPSAYVTAVYHRPERMRERSDLDFMRREYNEHGGIEDGDFVNRQARHSAAWMYW